jgi:multicomponent Na+:H+ antiporter subunit B
VITPLEAALLGFVLLSALVTVFLRDVLAAVVAFAAYSLGLAVLWVTLQAPDVALTEAAIGAGVTTVLFLLTLTKTVRPPSGASVFKGINWPAAAVVVVLAGALLWTVPAIPAIGSADAPAWANPEVTQFYLGNAYDQTGVENAVTAVLAAYRGFDTFGEAVVVFAAGVAVLVVLREERFT